MRKQEQLRQLKIRDVEFFVYVGTVPNTELYNEIRLDNGFLTTDENMQTEIPGCICSW